MALPSAGGDRLARAPWRRSARRRAWNIAMVPKPGATRDPSPPWGSEAAQQIVGDALAQRREDLVLVLEAQAEREQDLALGVHAAGHTLLDAVDRAKGDPRLAGELRLGHESILPQLAHPVRLHRLGPVRFHASHSSARPRDLAFVSAVHVSTGRRISLELMRPCRFDAGSMRRRSSAASSRGCAAPTRARLTRGNPRFTSAAGSPDARPGVSRAGGR